MMRTQNYVKASGRCLQEKTSFKLKLVSAFEFGSFMTCLGQRKYGLLLHQGYITTSYPRYDVC